LSITIPALTEALGAIRSKQGSNKAQLVKTKRRKILKKKKKGKEID